MTTRLEQLHTDLIDTLEAHIAFYNAVMTKYSKAVTTAGGMHTFEPVKPRKYHCARSCRLQVMQSLKTIRAWSTDDFRYALHTNWRGIQAHVFADQA